MGKSEFNKQRTKTDIIFSRYIRLLAADEYGYVKCVTCGKIGHWENDYMFCGHYIPRAKMATRFDELNCHVQCYHCNEILKGNILEYNKYMIEKYGIGKVEMLKKKAKGDCVLKTHDMRLIEQNYKEKVKILRLERGL